MKSFFTPLFRIFLIFFAYGIFYLFFTTVVSANYSCPATYWSAATGTIDVTGTCIYSNNNAPPNWTLDPNNACTTIFGWFCPDYTCQDVNGSWIDYTDPFIQVHCTSGIGFNSIQGSRVRCCGPIPPTCAVNAGGTCSQNGSCPVDQVSASSQYECSPNACCRPITCNDLSDTNSVCSKLGHPCSTGYTADYTDNAAQNDCQNSNQELCCSQKQSCNGGSVTNNVCNVSNPPLNTCGTMAGSVTHTTTTYVHPQCGQAGTSGNGYTCTPSTSCNQVNSYTGCNTFFDNCNSGAGYTCVNGNTCVTHIYVNVYKDYNHDGVKNGNDVGKSGVTISDGGGNNVPTDANGNVTFSGKTTGNYTITMTVPSGYQAVGSTSKTASLTNTSGNVTVNFYLTPLYTLSGTVFSDKNKNQNFDGSDTGISGMNVNITGPGVNTTKATDASGNYSFSNLLSNNYTVSVTSSLAAGYEYTTPYTWAVTLGDRSGSPTCQVSTSPDAVCGNPNNGSISGLNFGATNEKPHYSSVCLDIRTDNSGGATISDPLPAPGATCGGQNGSEAIINNGTCSTGSGIVYSCNGTFDFDLGTSDANNWTAGGTAAQDSECYSGPGLDVIPTSYNYLLTTAKESNITPTNLDNTQPGATASTSCDVTDCVLPSNLPKGIYQVNGNLTLHAASYTFPAPADPTKNSQAYIILVNGDLRIQGNIYVPKGSVVVFSASGNIYVDKSVGNIITDPTSSTVNAPDLEGVYSSDHNFTAESYGSGTAICNIDGTPLDKRLVILGVVITNASKTGGAFLNSRDLCTYDTSCSSVVTGDGTNGGDGLGGSGEGLLLNYLLNLIADGKFLNNKNFNWQELKP